MYISYVHYIIIIDSTMIAIGIVHKLNCRSNLIQSYKIILEKMIRIVENINKLLDFRI